MVFRRKTLALAVLYAVGGAGLGAFAVTPAFAQQQPTDQPTTKIEKVVVTGSNIKRIEGETATPVQVITRKEIERTGATNLNELMRALPSIDIFDQGELASNSPAGSGTATVRMRGLSETNVLVLLNGRRLPVNALYDSSGAGAAFDINMIPIGAIERVEILKDGGSAIYGADAVAGVVNFITRKDYTGLEARVGYGTSSRSDGQEQTVGVTGGWGTLDKDRFNVLASFEYFKRDPILRQDRDISSSVDFRRFGGPDRRSVFSPYGNLLDDEFNFTGETVKPCPPENFSGGLCRYDFNNSLLTAYNGADRWTAMVVGAFQFSPNWKGFGQFFMGEAKDHFEAHPVPDFFLLPSGQYYTGRFMQGGPRITDRKSKLDEFIIGVEGSIGGIDLNVAAGQGKSRVENRDKNYYNSDLWNEALGNGLIDATVSTNDPALVESLKVTPLRSGKSQISFFDAKVSGELFQMKAGPFAYAAGVSAWREELTDTPDELTQQGLVIGSIQQAPVNASRSAKALFGEVNVPVGMGIEVQGAVRFDDYPTDSRTSPKVAARWQPNKMFLMRASYSESFKMPTLKQLYGAQEQGAINISSDEECQAIGQPAGCFIPAYQVNGANPNLKPEIGKTFNIGGVLESGPLTLGLDWFKIEKRDNISSPTILSSLLAGRTARAPNGQLLVYTNLQNTSFFETSGFDMDAELKFSLGSLGKLGLRDVATYYLYQRQRGAGSDPWYNYVDTYATPRWRNYFKTEWEMGAWVVGLTWRTVANFRDTDDPPTGEEPIPASVRTVGKHEEGDIQVSWSGIKNLRVDLGVKNFLDRMPPISIQNVSSNAYTQMGFAELYTNRGRFFYGSVNYKFK
jgi:iron complex outermembrane receptor protein